MLIHSTYDKLISLLDSTDARYRIIEHVTEGRTDIVSALRKNSLAQAAKSIVMRVSVTKKKGKYLLGVIPGDKYIDFIKLTKLVGGTKAVFAARHVAERLTGSGADQYRRFPSISSWRSSSTRVCSFTTRYFSTRHDWIGLSPSM